MRLKKFADWLNLLLENIFSPTAESLWWKIFHNFCLALMFLFGIAYWCWFYDLGRLTFVYHDWPIFYKYTSIIQQAVVDKVIPYYWSTDQIHGTDRFLAIPSSIISPQIYLMKFLSLGTFFMVHFQILYSVGFIGCLLIKRKFKLSLFTFSILYMFFMFNGHIISHLSVGHCSWGGYFLLPFFILWLMQMVEGDHSRQQIGKMGFILFAMVLQGSFHIYVWCLLFLLLLCVQGKNLRNPILFTILLTFFLAAFRFLPAAVTLYKYKHGFVSGFPSLTVLIESLIMIRDHNFFVPMGSVVGVRVGWWEFSHYITFLGFAMLLYFGIYQRVKNYSTDDPHLFRPFDLPMIVLTIFSLSYIFGLISSLPIPLINVERNSSRFLLIPLFFLMVISCVRFQDTLNNHKISAGVGLLALAGALHGLFSLGTNSLNWQLRNQESFFKNQQVNLDVSIVPLSQKSEWIYVYSVNISFVVSALSLAALIYILWPSTKKKSA